MSPILSSLLFLLSTGAWASPIDRPTAAENPLVKRATTPKVASASLVGIASDPNLDRDSCTSSLVDYRAFWTCRDTSDNSNGAFYVSTASWSNYSNQSPEFVNGVLELYGNNGGDYYPIQPDECQSESSFCSNGNRYAIWPDTRVLPVQGSGGDVNLYTWIRKSYLNQGDLTNENPNPATSLYKGYYSLSQGVNANLPPQNIDVNGEEFWPAGAIPYGNYGWALSPDGNTAYLYGALADSQQNYMGTAVAQVPLASIDDKSRYTYWTGSSWSTTAPALDDTGAAIANAGQGQQGTFYYSSYFSSYVYIGNGHYGDNAVFYISTAPNPQGPFSDLQEIYNGAVGNNTGGLVAYSTQAHPGLTQSNGNGNDIWLSYTKVDADSNGNAIYTTPMIYITWQ